MLFSATFPEDVAKLSRKYMNNPVEIEIKASGITTATIEHSLIEVSEADKLALLQNLFIVENPDSLHRFLPYAGACGSIVQRNG